MVVDKFGRSPRMHVVCKDDSVGNKVSKSGDIMSGHLDMSGNRIMNIPYEPDGLNDVVSVKYVRQLCQDIKDEVVLKNGLNHMNGHLNMGSHNINNVLDPVVKQDVATKNYVDKRKHLITVWAEQRGDLIPEEFQFSFGNGGNHAKVGYVMMSPGRILRMSISAFSNGARGEVSVSSTINGVEQDSVFRVRKKDGDITGVKIFNQPLELLQGDRLNFKTITAGQNIRNAVVCTLIELDL